MNRPTDDDLAKLIDPDREVWLADYGLPGFTAAQTIDDAGATQLWIVDRDQLGGRDVDHGNQQPTHEHAGPLSQEWRSRIALTPLRCSRPRADGRPCRMPVSAPGQACAHHRRHLEAGVEKREPGS